VNYVQVAGRVSEIDTKDDSPEPSTFVFTSNDILDKDGNLRPLTVLCLKGTRADRELEQLSGADHIELVALRNVDLSEAMKGNFVISLLGIDIRAL
jgi:hypothetical protein